MNAPFRFTPQAVEDLDAIWWSIAEDNRDAAAKPGVADPATVHSGCFKGRQRDSGSCSAALGLKFRRACFVHNRRSPGRQFGWLERYLDTFARKKACKRTKKD
jgi:hypothetical protein